MRNHITALATPALACALAAAGCGAKGDPVPNRRHPPAACTVRAVGLRAVEAVLPTEDTQGNRLSGIEAVRVYYSRIGPGFPTPLEVFQQGTTVLELRRPDLPPPGRNVLLDLSHMGHSTGWLVVVAYRVGNIPGVPSQVLPWLDPAF